MNNVESFLRIMLGLHIAGGTLALITGMGAMLTAKGQKTHRTFGKIYFWSMTTVFVSALILAIGHQRLFLFMVAFFSYYLTVRGYRILFLKGLGRTIKPNWVDWVISIFAGTFIFLLIAWGAYVFSAGDTMGIVAMVFGGIGSTFLISDIRGYFGPAPEKMHWWYGHIAGMGGSYISAVTAFVVVNISIPGFSWVLWIIPSIIGGSLIGRTIRKYKLRFSAAA
jgi:uncharacterized membrane protein